MKINFKGKVGRVGMFGSVSPMSDIESIKYIYRGVNQCQEYHTYQLSKK